MASGSGSDDAGSPRIGSRRRASPPVPPDEDALSGSTSSSSSSAGSDDERESDEPATRTKRSRTVSSRLGSAQRPGLLQELAPQAQAAERIPSRADLRARHALLDPVRQLVDKDAPPISRAAQRLRAPVQVALATTPDVVKLQEAERKWLCKERAWLMRTMVKGNPSSQQEEEQFWEDVMVARAADGPTSGRTRRRRKRDRAKEKAWDSRAVQWARQQYDEFVEARPPDFLEPRNETWFQAPVEVSSVVDLKVKGQSLPDRLLKAATAGSARSGKAWDVATDKVRKFAVARMQGGSIGPVSLRRSGRDHHRQDTADSTALSLWLSGMSDSRGTSFDLAGLDQQNMDGDDVDRHRLVEAPEEALDEFDRLHSETGMAASSARSRGKARAGENLVVPAVILEGHELGPDLGDEGTPSGGVSPARSRLSLATSSPTSVATSRAPSPVLLGQGETVESPSALDDDPFRRFEFPPRIHPPSPDPSTKSAPLPDARSLMANGSNASSLLPNGSPRASPSGSPRARHRYLLPSLDFGSLGTSSPSEGARDGHCVRDSRDEGSLRSGYSTPGRPADDEARSPTSNLASPIWRATRFADDSILTLAHLDDSAKRRHGLHLRHHRAHRKHRAGGDDDQRASRTSLLSDARTAVTGRTVRKGPRGSMGDYVPGWRGRKPDGPRATKLRTLNAEKEALAAAELAEMLAEVAQEDEQQQDLRETEKLYQRQAGLVLFGRTHFASRIATVRWQTIKRIKDRTSRDWDALYTSADIRPKLVYEALDSAPPEQRADLLLQGIAVRHHLVPATDGRLALDQRLVRRHATRRGCRRLGILRLPHLAMARGSHEPAQLQPPTRLCSHQGACTAQAGRPQGPGRRSSPTENRRFRGPRRLVRACAWARLRQSRDVSGHVAPAEAGLWPRSRPSRPFHPAALAPGRT